MDIEERNDEQFCICVWCGNWISRYTYAKRKERNLTDLDVCRDCRDVRKAPLFHKNKSVRTNHPELGVLWCYIWAGDLNDDWLPIDDEGNLFMPGERICGLKDCVAEQHVIKPEPITVSDIDLILGMHEMQQYNKRVRANNG